MRGLQSVSYDVRNGRNPYHLIPYIGNKSGFAHIFDELVPEDAGSADIIDVFGGSGAFAIYCSFRFGSRHITYNDNNPVVTNFMKHVRDDPDGLMEQYEEHRNLSGGEYFLQVRNMDIRTGVEGAGRFLYLAKNAFSGKIRFNGSGRFNAPMRKGAGCPRLNKRRFLDISSSISHMRITTQPFQYWSGVKNAFLYLDPPYMNNTNTHYNMVPSTESFMQFVQEITPHNRVMISEQNEPADIGIPDCYAVYSVWLRRSLQYVTQKDSREIIAINYVPQEGGGRLLGKFL